MSSNNPDQPSDQPPANQPPQQYPPYPPYPPYQPVYPPPPPEYGQPNYPPQPPYGYAPPPGSYPGGYPLPPSQSRGRNWPLIIAGLIGVAALLCVIACSGLVVMGSMIVSQGLQEASSSIQVTLSATETAIAQDVSPTPVETVIYQDSLTDQPQGWTNKGGCAPQSDGLHVASGGQCFAPDAANQSDTDVTVTALVAKADKTTAYGVVVRRVSAGDFYAFEVTPDGRWGFFRYTNGAATPVVNFQSDAAIHLGAGAPNELRVLAVGSHFVFSINGQQVGIASDATYTSGQIGLANFDSAPGSAVVFINLTVAQPAP